MTNIQKLFNEITTIRPERVGTLGINGLEEDLNHKVELLAKELWSLLPMSKEIEMPHINENEGIECCYISDNILRAYLGTHNESIKNISVLYKAIQERTKIKYPKIKGSSRMPSSLKDIIIDGTTEGVLGIYDDSTGIDGIEQACKAMGITSSPEKLAAYGEMLFDAYITATNRFEEFLRTAASYLMTEEEIKELTEYNCYTKIFLPSIYNNDDKLIELYNRLIKHNYLDKDTSIEDFIYFFSGNGKTPTCSLLWRGNNVELGVFLDCYFIIYQYEIENKWQISHKIFEKKGLRQSLNNANNNTNPKIMKERYNLFNTILNI